MRDYANILIDLLVSDNRAFIEQIKAEARSKKQAKLKAKADCQCNGGGFTYCEACHGE